MNAKQVATRSRTSRSGDRTSLFTMGFILSQERSWPARGGGGGERDWGAEASGAAAGGRDSPSRARTTDAQSYSRCHPLARRRRNIAMRSSAGDPCPKTVGPGRDLSLEDIRLYFYDKEIIIDSNLKFSVNYTESMYKLFNRPSCCKCCSCNRPCCSHRSTRKGQCRGCRDLW